MGFILNNYHDLVTQPISVTDKEAVKTPQYPQGQKLQDLREANMRGEVKFGANDKSNEETDSTHTNK